MSMKYTVISYSRTGNNDKLADSVSKTLDARHVRITEPGERNNAMIALDMLFNRIPKINEKMKDIDTGGLVIFIGPVWMGKVASPLRGPMKELEARTRNYVFITLSGGSDGPNDKLAKELKKRLGKDPLNVFDLHITDILDRDEKPTRQEISDYRLKDSHSEKLTNSIIKELKERSIIPK